MRLATANTFESSVNNITARQSDLARQLEKVSSGTRVTKGSDDPISAARAERALSRIADLKAEQRALNVQKDALSVAESALGDAGTLLQRFRELAVSAGNASNSSTDRTTIANEMQSIRDQVLSLANTKDSNGIYLFSGREAAKSQGVTTPAITVSGAPASQSYTFNGTAGLNSPTQEGVPFTMDGDAIWMQVPKGNGLYDVTVGATNTGQLSTDLGQFTTTPAGGTTLTGSYQISFTVTGNATTYSVNTTPPSTGTYVSGQQISFTDTTVAPNANITLAVNGIAKTGDTVNITPYTTPASAVNSNPANGSLFELMDKVISGVSGVGSGNAGLAQTVAQGLSRLDAGLERVQSARGQAGLWLSRADSITNSNEAMSNQLETDRSNAQDLDMVDGIATQQRMQTGYQAALQSYAQIQKLSLFDYIR